MIATAEPIEAAGQITQFAAEDRLSRDLVRDLHEVRPAIYWLDLAASCVIGWFAFFLALALRPLSPAMLVTYAVAVISLYRGLCFIHEITHQSSRSLPHFETAWNLAIGYPLLLPSFVYVGVHQFHHKLATYGTPEDPEYLPFARSSRRTVLFAVQSVLIPIALLVRFLILAPLALLFPGLQRWLVVHGSSLSMNPAFCRDASPELIAIIRRHSVFVLTLWTAALVGMFARGAHWKSILLWIAVSAGISFINTLRTLGAHNYESSGEPMGRTEQLADSIDTPGAPWTELWAPVGLRYHALHHYFAGIPYHNLPEAWSRLSRSLPADAQYRKVSSSGLLHSLRALYNKGRRRSS